MTIRLKNVLIIFGITIAVYLTMKYMLPLVVPFLIAYLIVRWINPLTEKLHRKMKVNKSLLAAVLIAAAVLVLGGLLWLLAGKILAQIKYFVENMDVYQGQMMQMVNNICDSAEQMFGLDPTSVKVFIMDNIDRGLNGLKGDFLPEMLGSSYSYFKQFLQGFAAVAITIISVILLQKDYDKIREVGRENFYFNKIRRVCKRVLESGGAYFKAQLLIMTIIGSLCVIGLMILKNPYALIIGIIIGILDALPVLGTGTVFIPWAVIKVLQMDFFHAAAYATMWGVTCFTREFLEPKLIGKRLGIYPILIIMTIYIGLYLFGVSGILLGPLSLLIIIEIARESGLLE